MTPNDRTPDEPPESTPSEDAPGRGSRDAPRRGPWGPSRRGRRDAPGEGSRDAPGGGSHDASSDEPPDAQEDETRRASHAPSTPEEREDRTKKPLPRFALGVLGLSLLAALLGVLSGFGSRWGFWSFGTGFTLLRWAAYGALAVLVLAAVAIVLARRRGSRRGLLAGALALAIGAVTVAIPVANLWAARSAPPIHDISTDTNDPPEFVAVAPLRADAPNPVEYSGQETARLQREAYPDIRPAILDLPFAQAFQRALDTAEAQGWEIVEANADDGRIEATDRTFWFGFTDDIVIRVTRLEDRSVIDVRSKSRVGRGDVGTNAERVRDFLNDVGG